MTDMQSGPQSEPFDVEMGDHLEDMIRDLGQESFQQAHALVYKGLQSDSKKPLYPGCNNSLTLLSVMLSLVNVKARYGWSDKSFTLLFQVVHDLLPEKNTLPKTTIKPRRYYVRWIWSIRKFMLARMTAYCTDMNSKKCPNALGVGRHGTK